MFEQRQQVHPPLATNTATYHYLEIIRIRVTNKTVRAQIKMDSDVPERYYYSGFHQNIVGTWTTTLI